MNEYEHVLTSDEKILWQGKPRFPPYWASMVFPGMFLPLFPMIIIGPFLVISYGLSRNTPSPFGGIFFPLSLILASPFIILFLWKIIGNPLYRIAEYQVLQYVLTDKRILIQRGLIGRDVVSINLDAIIGVTVDVGFWDILWGRREHRTGTLIITQPGTAPQFLRNIPDPYEISAIIQSFCKKESPAKT
ncbi:MAG: PH domain-containing protein [Treponemataceae bacterium]|nr:PH domain-containing protein [Treponemataceae bacterium]